MWRGSNAKGFRYYRIIQVFSGEYARFVRALQIFIKISVVITSNICIKFSVELILLSVQDGGFSSFLGKYALFNILLCFTNQFMQTGFNSGGLPDLKIGGLRLLGTLVENS